MVSERATSGVDVRRVEDATWRPLEGMQLRPLATFYGAEMIYVSTATVNAEGHVSEAHEPGSAESLLVLSGTVMAGPNDGLVELKAGDWIRFPSDRAHACHACGGEDAEVLFVAVRKSIPGVDGLARTKPAAEARAMPVE
ncbi:cupin domain-containing protein [Comamonas sp.]|uniref:cupin domain-containing protein n=2 Tax=unclassified Comamonas TaxID=2638500 RepID=UPI003430447F